MRQGDTVDGKREGLWVSYYANGQKQSEGEYRAGKKHGRWVLYYPNGSKQSEAKFHNGLYTGLYIAWRDNGAIQWQGYYNPIRGNSADGTKEGVWLAYDPETGEPARAISYHRGSRTKPDELAPFDVPPKLGPDPAG